MRALLVGTVSISLCYKKADHEDHDGRGQDASHPLRALEHLQSRSDQRTKVSFATFGGSPSRIITGSVSIEPRPAIMLIVPATRPTRRGYRS